MSVQRLASLLDNLGLGANEEDLRDLLWLAPIIGPPAGRPDAGPGPGLHQPTAPAPAPESHPERPDEPRRVPPENGPGGPADTAGGPPRRESAHWLHLQPAHDAESPGGREAAAVRAPAASALGSELQLGRALRPLMRKVPSTHWYLMDEDATAARVAEERIWIPALRPAPTRWLELAVVVDGYQSMSIWRQTVIELRSLLERLGAFRDVRFWVLDELTSDPLTSDPPQLILRRWQADSAPRSPGELIDPSGLRAIMVISDCLGPMWRSGTAQQLLAEWGRHGPVAILQPLPQRLWAYSHARPVLTCLRSARAGGTNAKLTFSAGTRPVTQFQEDAVPVPVLELDADWLASWSRLISASGTTGVDAMVVFGGGRRVPDGSAAAQDSLASVAPLVPPQPQARVRRFRATASPEAFQLAVYLAAAPISLPVIRLVQWTMQKARKQSHVAEVFLGGLLRQMEPENPVDPDSTQYDFLPGVRDELLQRLRRHDALRVLAEVSRFVDAQFGQARDFPALLAGEGITGEYVIEPDSRPFAEVAAHVLRLLGGNYTTAADRLASALPGAPAAPAHNRPSGSRAAVPAYDRSRAAERERVKFEQALAEISVAAGRSRERPLVCPYCYHAFGERDISFRCPGSPGRGREACSHKVDEGLRKLGRHEILPPVFAPHARQDEAICPDCKGVTRLQVCPDCHSSLPANFRAAQGRLIALIGPRQAGKTAFMTVLVHELRHEAGERLDSSTIGADENTRERYPDVYESPLYRDRVLPDPTRVADDYIAPLVFRFRITQPWMRYRQRQHELLFSFTDGAGEDLTRHDKLERVARYLAAADAIMVIIDPLQLGKVRNLLRRKTALPPLLPADERPVASLERITRLLQADSGGNMIDKPVAFVLTKLDMVWPLMPPDSPLRALAPSAPYFDAADSDAVQREVSALLDGWNAPQLDQMARENYTRYRYFPASALGAPPTPDNRVPPQGVRPYRVTDPFLWLLSEFSLVRAQAK